MQCCCAGSTCWLAPCRRRCTCSTCIGGGDTPTSLSANERAPAMVALAVAMVLRANISVINVDLICGLTLESANTLLGRG